MVQIGRYGAQVVTVTNIKIDLESWKCVKKHRIDALKDVSEYFGGILKKTLNFINLL